MSETASQTDRKWIGAAIGFQALVLVLSAFTMDQGEAAVAFLYGSFAFWVGAVVVLRKRHSMLTGGDVLYLRFGLPGLAALSLGVAPLIWTLRGAW